MCQAVRRRHMTVSIHQRKNAYYFLSCKQSVRNATVSNPLDISVFVKSRMEIFHFAIRVWFPVVSLRLHFSPWRFFSLLFPCAAMLHFSPSHFVCVCLCVCVCACMCESECINYWLRVYSRLPQGLQPSNMAIPSSCLFVFQHFCFKSLDTTQHQTKGLQ